MLRSSYDQMRIHAAISSALGLQFLLFPLPIALGQEPVRPSPPDCERLVEFRDGSILRLQLPASYEFGFHNVDGGGAPELSRVPLSSPLGIRFSELPALRQLGTIQEAAAQLRVDSFQLREQALRTLVRGSNGFRPFIEDLFQEDSDPESRWRLATVLELIPSQPGIYQHAYDELITADAIIKGDVQDWRIALDYRGSGIVLDRKSVRAIRRIPQEREQWDTPVIASTEAIREDLDALFPHDCMRIDFEFDSMGDALRPGQDISHRFVPDGVVISTSIPDSFFSVNDFTVSGRSGGQSGATHDPLFYGTVSLTFCVPGNENEPAGVTHIGLYAAIVQEAGTSLAAYDASGHRIATVVTETGPHQFIGLRSNVPMHRVEIIPTKSDPDVTIDDLVFSIPEALDAGGAAEGFTLDFASRERIVCADFRLAGDAILARPAGGFAGEIELPATELVRLQTPAGREPGPAGRDAGEKWFWIMLEDGSTLLAKEGRGDQGPKTVFHDIPVGSLPLGALWSEGDSLKQYPTDLQLEEEQLAVINRSPPTVLESPILTPAKLTAVNGDATVEWSYNRLPSIWLKQPNDREHGRARGFIRLITSERIILGENSTFELGRFDSQTLSLRYRDQTFEVPIEMITSLRLPKSK